MANNSVRKRTMDKMTKDQYIRANTAALISIICIIVFAIGVKVPTLMNKGFSPRTLFEFVVATAGLGMIIFGYAKERDNRKGAVLLMGGISAIYFIVVVLDSDTYFYLFGIPILITAIVYLDMRLLRFGIGVFSTAIIINIASYYVRNGKLTIVEVVYLVSLFVICFTAYRMMSLLTAFNEENNDVIKKNREIEKAAGERMISTAQNISELFEQARDNVASVEQIMNNNLDGMTNISNGIEHTANAIVDQSGKCSDIAGVADSTQNRCIEMRELTDDTTNTVREGTAVIEKLEDASNRVKEASDLTEQSTSKVREKVNDVHEIVGSIIKIAGQTNLLALNASIESARAGEAGRGFAVVADSVRDLSVETEQASERIEEIIQDLANEAETAKRHTEETVATISAQREMIDQTRDKFSSIRESVREMTSKFGDIEDAMRKIAESTGEMNSNISDVSSTSEEISALSNVGVETSRDALHKFEELRAILGKIAGQADQLSGSNE